MKKHYLGAISAACLYVALFSGPALAGDADGLAGHHDPNLHNSNSTTTTSGLVATQPEAEFLVPTRVERSTRVGQILRATDATRATRGWLDRLRVVWLSAVSRLHV